MNNIQWYPGHMTKTKRMIVSEIGHMDAVCEIVDARIPQSSRNPDVDELTAGKPRLMVLNRVDQADPAETKKWAAAFRAQGFAVLEANARGGVGTEKFAAAVRELLKDKLDELMKQFMEQIPDSLIESARLDGAGEFRIFFSIIMPNVKPAWLTLAIFQFQTLWANTGSGFLRSEQLKPLQYALYQIVAGGPARQGAGAVVQLIIAAIPITFFIICQSNVIETMTTSGMKD